MAVELRGSRLPPPWLGHLLVFGLLLILVVGWFFAQTRQAERIFSEDASEHARLLADAVTLHARGALLAEEVTATILRRFLGSSARFVDYLDQIAPFQPDELTAFAAETDLSVIHILRADGVRVQGPEDWRADLALDCARLEQLIRLPEAHSILFGIRSSEEGGCVLVGMDSRRTEALESAIGLPKALAAIAALPGVIAVRLEGEAQIDARQLLESALPQIRIIQAADGRLLAQASAPVAGAVLRLDLDAGPLQRMKARLWWEFLAFALVLALSGSVGAWVLYLHQRAHARQRLGYERRLSRQREEAGLGRAAAAIAHEIRNPLNTIGMGLQRLQLEADALSDEHRRLLELVREAVQRANGAVSGLLDYARPIQINRQPLTLDSLIADHLSLYTHALAQRGIRLAVDLQPGVSLFADSSLLHQVLDNLLRNALEAEQAGGYIEIQLRHAPSGAHLTLTNGGLNVEVDAVERLLEPWYTTKTTGAGLGLSISQRIIAAHGGQLRLSAPQPGRLCVTIVLPIRSTLELEP